MPDSPTTALVRTAQSPALARVSSQLALTDKLLTKPEEPFLIPYRKGDKWGFCDRNKNIVIDCLYDDARAFYDGLAAVRINPRSPSEQSQLKQCVDFQNPEDSTGLNMDGWGFINKSGELVVSCDYSCVWEYSEGFAAVTKGSWLFTDYNLVDKQGNVWPNLSIPARNYDRLVISDGLVYVNRSFNNFKSTHGLVKYYNGYGNHIAKQFPDIQEFSEGLAAVRKNRKWGFVNKEGSIVIPLQYVNAHSFSETVASVSIESDKNIYINKQDDIVLKHKYEYGYSFSGGLAKVITGWESRHDRCGYMNKQGDLAIPFKFIDCKSFSEGLARVLNKEGLWGFINTEGNLVIPHKYKSYIEGSEVKYWGEGSSEPETGVLYDTSYHLDYELDFRGGLARVVSKNIEFYIDRNGNEYYER